MSAVQVTASPEERPATRLARPDAAYYHRELGEFILPYAAVRAAQEPEAAIRDFVASTYERGADLAEWDRAPLDVTGGASPGAG